MVRGSLMIGPRYSERNTATTSAYPWVVQCDRDFANGAPQVMRSRSATTGDSVSDGSQRIDARNVTNPLRTQTPRISNQ